MSDRVFSIVRNLSRRELERHQKRFIGITVKAPEFIDVNEDGIMEWVCDVRVGVKEGWAVVRDVILAQWVVGIIADMNIPVLCERSEAGRVTIIARSEVRLPDIVYTVHSLSALDLGFMEPCRKVGSKYLDGFGHQVVAPRSDVITVTHTLDSEYTDLGMSRFVFGNTPLGDQTYEWKQE